MWAVKLLLKIMILPMILLIGVARQGVTLAIKIYGFASLWLWVLLGIVVIMTVCQQNWSQTILALSMGAITFVVLFAAVWIQVTLVLIFASQTEVILSNPLHIILIAVPLTIQTVFIFAISYVASKLLKLSHDIAAPAGMIGASNFFELAVAVAIALFGTTSPAALATTVGVLTEVPVMLALCWFANKTKGWFK